MQHMSRAGDRLGDVEGFPLSGCITIATTSQGFSAPWWEDRLPGQHRRELTVKFAPRPIYRGSFTRLRLHEL